MSKQMMTATEIAGIMDVSKNQGYVIIRQFNEEDKCPEHSAVRGICLEYVDVGN